MLSRGVVLITLMCVANTLSISIINISEDTEKNIKPFRECKNEQCDYLCKQIGFPRGSCDNDQCICDNYRKITIVSKIKAYQSIDDCDPINCDQLCRRIGFPGGVCVNGKCKCDIISRIDVFNTIKNKFITKLKSCNPMKCNDACQGLNYPGGICVGDICKCS